jgi:tryptophanyl-tRNA synthetase
MQPSGNLHIGNLSPLRRWVASQDERQNIFCVVDLHALTVPRDPTTLREKTREVAALYLAAGIDPDRSIVFVQSHIPAHAELTWILNCITPLGWARRMTQFKEKSEKSMEEVSVGLFAYPMLMAADILLYQAHLVPVGEDQKQHVELTRDIAIRFNNLFGETFTVPEPEIGQIGARIMSLSEPRKKMSKSDSDAAGTLDLLDPPDVIRRKIIRAKTDALAGIAFDPTREGLFNLLSIYQLLSKQSREEIESHFADQGYAVLKREVADLVIATLAPLQERYRQITADPAYLGDILRYGADRVRPIAERTLADVKSKIGLR